MTTFTPRVGNRRNREHNRRISCKAEQTLLRGVMQRKCVEQQGHCDSQIIVCQVFIQTSCHGQSKHDADYRQRKHHLMLLRDPCSSMGNAQTMWAGTFEPSCRGKRILGVRMLPCKSANSHGKYISMCQCGHQALSSWPAS